MAYNPDEEIRRLKQISAKKPIIKRGLPDTSEGRDGDIAICLNNAGLGLYVKFNNRWYNFGQGRQVARGGSAAVDLSMRTSVENKTFNDLTILGTLSGKNNTIIVKEDLKVGVSESRDMLTIDGSGLALTTDVKVIGGISTAAAAMKFICGAPTGQDTYYSLWRSSSQKWKVGNDDTVGGSADTNTFKIETGTGTSFSDTSEFMLDTSGNATIKGDLTVSGGDATLKAANDAAASILLQADNSDDAGDDWKVIANTDQTLTVGNDIASAGSYVAHLTITPHATATSTVVSTAGSLKVGSNIIQASDGGSTITMDTSDNVTIANNLACNEITSGAVVWAEFPFNVQNAIHNRYYFRDVDDLDDFRKWDSNDTDPTGFNYRNVAGSYTVPEDCTLLAMSGVVANAGGTQNPTVYVFTGAVTEGTGDTTLADAGSVAVSIGTSYVPAKFSDTYDVDLSAGDIVVPMIRSVNLGATPDFYGSLTLKFITR